MEKKERRKNERCTEETGIVYSIMNQAEQHAAVARNYSRFGMYIVSDRPLSPGTTIVIRMPGCDTADNRHDSSPEGGPAAYFYKGTQLPSEACRELKTLVTAEVKRCENFRDLDRERYGIGVHYIGPAV